MCGILFTNRPDITKRKFIDSLNLMSYRGPDAPLCYYNHNGISLGHNRLSIMDIDSRSNQPFFSADGKFAIIYNGEVYNYKDLSRQYSIQMKTNCDTELILELYIKYGPKMLNWLNGMFSFIILNLEDDSFFVARDRLGVKPLYFHIHNGKYIFSSEIAPILELIDNYSIDEIAVRQYRKLRNYFNGRTIYNQIKEFSPGHYMFDGNLYRYWNLDFSEKEPPSDEELKYLVESAVEYRKIADVSIGSYLSGGLDSTIVTGIANVEHTWTIGFNNSNEFQWSEIAAKLYHTNHHPIKIENDTFLDLCQQIVKIRKEPISVPNEVLIYFMTKLAKQENKVILSGEGADELFFGYDRIFRWANSVKTWDIKEFSQLYAYGTADDLEIVEDAISPFLDTKNPLNTVASFFQIAHLRGLLKRLDSATMLSSVEARSPFLDYRLVERLAGTSFEYKMKDSIVKAPLKRVFKNLVPHEIINRKKVGFPVPIDSIIPQNVEGESSMDKWFNYNLALIKENL